MSILDFVNQIHSDEANSIVQCFDQIMILYNFVGTRNNVSISIDGSNASFEIVFTNNSDAENLYEFLNGTEFIVYQSKYNIEMQLSGVTVLTKIYKVIP